VLRPSSPEEVALALKWASETGVAVVPAGGRSGVSGGTVTHGGELVLDMRALDQVIELDEVSGIVHVQAGILGTELEAWLNARGHTHGHFPQSVALSSVGGWIAARSAGQLSSGYGAVEDFLVALTAALPDGTLATSRLVPRTAAGPQVHTLMLGSEGTLGVVTEAWLRVRRVPATRKMASLAFASFAEGLEGVRRMAQSGALPDCARVYDEGDTGIVFRSLDPAPEGCVGLVVVEGDVLGKPADARDSRNEHIDFFPLPPYLFLLPAFVTQPPIRERLLHDNLHPRVVCVLQRRLRASLEKVPRRLY